MRILVHLHIYYEEQLPEFLDKLLRIQKCVQLHLAVTIPENHPCFFGIKSQITQCFPEAEVYALPNIGYDIFPFIFILKKSNLNEYDYVLKLHTKGRTDRNLTYLNDCALTDRQWAESLVHALIGSPHCFRKAIHLFESNSQLGMVGAGSCVIEGDEYLQLINTELTCMQLPAISSLKFIAGTMFLARTALLKPLCKYNESDFQKSEKDVKSGTFAHICERLFGGIVQAQGCSLSGLPLSMTERITRVACEIYLFFCRAISRLTLLLRIRAYSALLRHSPLFNKAWYKMEYLNSSISFWDPALHFLLYGGFHGMDPSPEFSSDAYFRCNPDIRRKGKNPLIHYLLHGQSEGRRFYSARNQ